MTSSTIEGFVVGSPPSVLISADRGRSPALPPLPARCSAGVTRPGKGQSHFRRQTDRQTDDPIVSHYIDAITPQTLSEPAGFEPPIVSTTPHFLLVRRFLEGVARLQLF
jgi:hypothetical protein